MVHPYLRRIELEKRVKQMPTLTGNCFDKQAIKKRCITPLNRPATLVSKLSMTLNISRVKTDRAILLFIYMQKYKWYVFPLESVLRIYKYFLWQLVLLWLSKQKLTHLGYTQKQTRAIKKTREFN